MLVAWDVNLPIWAGCHPRKLTLLFLEENVMLVGRRSNMAVACEAMQAKTRQPKTKERTTKE